MTFQDHDECVRKVMDYFSLKNIKCENFEKIVGADGPKRPDLLLTDLNTLIEIKTIAPSAEEKEEEDKIKRMVSDGGTASYTYPIFRTKFKDDLEDSRRKFRNFEDYSTVVIIFDLFGFHFKQRPELLLCGEQQLNITIPNDSKEEPYVNSSQQNDRCIRRDLNTEIGAIVFYDDKDFFKIFYNIFCEDKRRIDSTIFNFDNNEHYNFIDDKSNPLIVKLNV